MEDATADPLSERMQNHSEATKAVRQAPIDEILPQGLA